jgi:hypothetical protein
MALRSHIIVAANFGPYDDERHYAKELWPQIPSNSLALVDRNFLAANILLTYSAEQENRHFLRRLQPTSATLGSVQRWLSLRWTSSGVK